MNVYVEFLKLVAKSCGACLLLGFLLVFGVQTVNFLYYYEPLLAAAFGFIGVGVVVAIIIWFSERY